MVIGISDKLVKGDGPVTATVLKSFPVLYYSNEESDYLRQAFIKSLGPAGKDVNVQRVFSFEQMQMLVSLGKAVSFYPAKLVTRLARQEEHIKYLKMAVSTSQHFSFKLIYKANNHNLILQDYVSTYQEKCS